MKTITAIILVTMAIFGNNYSKNEPQSENCFSKENFEIVYIYIEKQIKANNSLFFEFEDYEIYLNKEEKVILLKKDGYTHSKIDEEKGIYSLNKSQKNNEKMVNKANQIFCKLLALTQ